MFLALLAGQKLQVVRAPEHKIYIRDDGMLCVNGGNWKEVYNELDNLTPVLWELSTEWILIYWSILPVEKLTSQTLPLPKALPPFNIKKLLRVLIPIKPFSFQ